MKVSNIKNPVSSISGIGPQLTKILSKINIFTVGDLLQYYPYDYDDLTKKITLDKYNQYKKVHTVARVLKQEWFGYGNMRTLKIIIDDETATAELICFNRNFLEKTLPVGSIISVTGQFSLRYNCIQSSSFEAEKMNSLSLEPNLPLRDILPLNTKVLPIYHLTEGLSQKALKKAISKALQQYGHGLEDEISQELLLKHSLMNKQQAVKYIHEPATMEDAQKARKSLVYEELFLFQEVILSRAKKRKGKASTEKINSQAFVSEEAFLEKLSPLQKQFLDTLKFSLTDDQRKVIYEMNSEIDRSYTERERILNQLERGIPLPIRTSFSMARLLQGDVGSGKTLVSLFIALRILSWKGQCALMSPTEILARQHAETTQTFLGSLGIRIAFLTGNLKAAGRNQLLKNLKNGDIDIIVGTHALFSSNVIFKDLELVIIDEQHRFGVQQRQSIIEKGRKTFHNFTFEPNLLMMSATPIPQSLALSVFGDLDISTIHTKPLGRKDIQTFLVKEGNEINAYEEVRKELKKGHQSYFVYPAIDSDENIKSAEKAFIHLRDKIYPQYKCELLHSKIDESKQIEILQQFREGKIQVLAATTVIEVGVDVPNATCMVIEQADRFGMAQLHQLRGRVGRGSEQSYCFLIYSKNITETGIERMKALRQSTDGFFIAEQDLKTRGPGELSGTLQAGALEFRIADLSKDMQIMEAARNDCLQLLNYAT